jgi:hypothetical protein
MVKPCQSMGFKGNDEFPLLRKNGHVIDAKEWFRFG